MLRILLFFAFIFFAGIGFCQKQITKQEAINLAGSNSIYSNPAQLDLQRQQQLLKGARGFDNPELEFEIDPYDPMVLGVLMPLRFPSVYASRRTLQKQRVRVSELLLQLNQYEINRLVQNTYTEVQYLSARLKLLEQQDSLYQTIKTAAQRNFQAGQINKLEELFASNEANNIRNELERATIELSAQKRGLSYILNINEDFIVDDFYAITIEPVTVPLMDTISNSIRPQLLKQQVMLSEQELKAERAELLPHLNTGPLFGLENKHDGDKKQGWRIGIAIPLWVNQNKARINAAKTGVQLAEAQRKKELQDMNRQYSILLSQFFKEQKSIRYYTEVANRQAAEIIETALRLFQAGQANYIETVRNIITAYQTRANYLETIRNYNQAIIELKYLNGTL
jgi:outer membrane protein TolC